MRGVTTESGRAETAANVRVDVVREGRGRDQDAQGRVLTGSREGVRGRAQARRRQGESRGPARTDAGEDVGGGMGGAGAGGGRGRDGETLTLSESRGVVSGWEAHGLESTRTGIEMGGWMDRCDGMGADGIETACTALRISRGRAGG